ncbi:MAG TPA: RES family NAD+ phosphorylase [Ilumatobacteraceae bacterium]|nr:RES family NAD+ phosphorylase [Ilumatobacteraceae bacterium]HRB02453.1 RES family NAD+ phosphorylase [Ilumatobacteraceae bacterium]
MHLWRLAARNHAATAISGEGAAAFGGRWNPPGRRMVYTAQSLALATLELSVHITGGRVKYIAMQFELPDRLVDSLELGGLKKSWPTSESATQRIGEAWLDSARSAAMAVPSALVDARSGERNVLLNPLHPALSALRELQRFEVVLDERL